MGDEIPVETFTVRDFQSFDAALREETRLLREALQQRAAEPPQPVAGFELETWLVDRNWCAAPRNEEFLALLDDELVVPELARFNVEFNTTPQDLTGGALDRIETSLRSNWRAAQNRVRHIGLRLLMIGILPTVRQEQLCVDNMSDRARYRALNEQVLRMRHNRPLVLDISGCQRLHLQQSNVMLESAATSLQIHLQVPWRQAADYYDAAQVVAAVMVAACSNSPYLFGHDLWAETRIPLFEQAVNTAISDERGTSVPARVTFGDRYLQRTILDLFQENLERFPVLLPSVTADDPSKMHHLRLHNGTIWRWNRPLVGCDDGGVANLRIEHRVVPAGPSVTDIVANATLFFGLVEALVKHHQDFRERLPFAVAKANFYTAARAGLDAEVRWLSPQPRSVGELILEDLLPLAATALVRLNLDQSHISHYLQIVERRVARRQTGADWQRGFVARHGDDMEALTAAYWERQESGEPVGEWDY